MRIPYRPTSDRHKRCRILRSDDHETIPYFPGSWFPRDDETGDYPLFCATSLALLKPWRDLTMLKDSTQSFREAYDDFLSTAPESILRTIENIQYFHRCSDKARETNESSCLTNEWAIASVEEGGRLDDDPEDVDDENHENASKEHTIENITEEDIEAAIANCFSTRERLYAKVAIDTADEIGLFDVPTTPLSFENFVGKGTNENLQLYQQWMQQIHEAEQGQTKVTRDEETDKGEVTIAGAGVDPSVSNLDSVETDDEAMNNWDEKNITAGLTNDQRKAYTILRNHLISHLRGEAPPQLRMLLLGEGGTGKSHVLEAVSQAYDHYDAREKFAKTAMTGIAASNIGGSTLHSWAGIPICRTRTDKWATHPSHDMAIRRARNMRGISLLANDECSMLTTDMLSDLSQVLSIVLGTRDLSVPFGGLSVLFTGDFHQIPPVGKQYSVLETSNDVNNITGRQNRALYLSKQPNSKCDLGRNIFTQLDTVVILTDQMRITDPVWMEILHHAREGDCTSDDLSILRSLILTNQNCDVPDFSKPPWRDAVLITPRNSVRAQWNTYSLAKYCATSGAHLYRFPAEDTTVEGPLSMAQRFLIAKMPGEQTADLSSKCEIALGMKVMVTENISTLANLANGSRGTISDIVLDPRERSFQPSEKELQTIQLRYPPLFIIIRTTGPFGIPSLQNLGEKEVPLGPLTRHFYIGSNPRTRITRRQFPITPVYAFTDYKSQGQTIPHTIVDIGKTSSFALTPFNAYVALSRTHGRESTRLLRDFDSELFTRHPSESLREEEIRLREMAKATSDKFDNGLYGRNSLTD